MNTTRIYFTDALDMEFDATVISSAPRDDAFDVVLDRTAFYPTSGGQPFDTGTLGDVAVVDVVDDGRRRDRCTCVDRAARRGRRGARRDRLAAAVRSHAAAHRAARAVRGVRAAVRRPDRRAFISARRLSTIDLAREVTPARDRRRRSRSQPHRLGGPAGRRSASRRGGSGGAAAAQGTGARRARCG